MDVIDLYQIHWPNPDEDIEEGWSTLAALQREGKVRYIGVSNFNVSQLKRIQNIAQVTSLQPPYSLIRRDIEQDILPYCQEHNIGVIVYSPMASGMLSGRMSRERALSLPADDWRSRNDEFKEPRLTRNLEVTQRLAEIAATQHANAGAAAIAWALRHPAATGAIVGARHPEQIDEIVAAASVKLSDTQAAELEALRGEVEPVDAFMSERNEILRLEKYKQDATISQLRARVAALEEAAAKVLPFNVENGPDYASVYFGDGSTHSTQAMTMNPQDWLDLEAALRALLNQNGDA